MENMNSDSENTTSAKVIATYTNAEDEVEKHFSRALLSAATPPQDDTHRRSSYLQEPLPPLFLQHNQSTVLPQGSRKRVCSAAEAVIVYPEFAAFLVEPQVDCYKDLPQLPGDSCDTAEHWMSMQSGGGVYGERELATTVYDECSDLLLLDITAASQHDSNIQLSDTDIKDLLDLGHVVTSFV